MINENKVDPFGDGDLVDKDLYMRNREIYKWVNKNSQSMS